MDKATGKVCLDITMSLDGFIAGPNDDVKALHAWLFNGETPSMHSELIHSSKASAEVFDTLVRTTGSIITGRRTYELSKAWGGKHPVNNSVIVVTHEVPKSAPSGPTQFTFVINGIESAVTQARMVAGEKNVYLMGGTNVAQQALRAGLVDEISIHLVPILCGNGILLFEKSVPVPMEFEQTAVIEAPGVTHLRYSVKPDSRERISSLS